VCVNETTVVEVKPFREVDAAFAEAYGEGGRSLEGWRARAWAWYVDDCYALGREPTPEMPVVCEQFTVAYPRPGERERS
jgi:uncharacterized protein YhfF